MVHFIVHGKTDTVGVAVTDLQRNQALVGWNMETDETLAGNSCEDIPLGHKIALKIIRSGEQVIKYNSLIGLATRDINPGHHVHTHNLKTARW